LQVCNVELYGHSSRMKTKCGYMFRISTQARTGMRFVEVGHLMMHWKIRGSE
jgi:uncharacterized membrane protein (UPF0127 family)